MSARAEMAGEKAVELFVESFERPDQKVETVCYWIQMLLASVVLVTLLVGVLSLVGAMSGQPDEYCPQILCGNAP